jgi:hypothetical protein
MKFVFDDKDFDFVRANVPGQKNELEIRKTDKKYYSIFEYSEKSVFEQGTFTKAELKILWKMLTRK